MTYDLTTGETQTPLTDGGWVVASGATIAGLPVLETQKYDSTGAPVGGPLFFPPRPYEQFNQFTGQYIIAPQPGGGYIAVIQTMWHAAAGEVDVVGADGAVLAQGSVSADHLGVTVGSDGGFVVSGLQAGVYGAPTDQPALTLFDASGHALSTQVMLPGQITSISPEGGGDFAVGWDDAGVTRTLALDPATAANLTTPAAPTAVLLDASGQPLPQGPATSEMFPILRVSVTQPGEVFVSYPTFDTASRGGGVPVSAADVARGYVDVPLALPPGNVTLGYVRVSDATGSASMEVRFGLNVAAPSGAVLSGHEGDVLQGTSLDDLFYAAGQGTETLTGGAGSDVFDFSALPWTPDVITDFTPGQDRLYLHGLFPQYGGIDPIAAGYVTLISDGHVGTDVLVNPDGHATAANPWPTFVVDLAGVPTAGLTAKDLFGGSTSPPPPPPPGGVTITGSGYGDVLTGGSGNDTVIASTPGTETMTGDGGADVFVFNQIPWTPDRITDFTLGQDKLDLHALYPGFTGSDPIAAGYVTLISDGQGGTDVLVNPDGHATAANPWPTFIVDLVGVSPAGLTANALFGGSTSPPPPPPPPPGGVTITGSGYGDVLTGGSGNDTVIASTPGTETMTGDGGADVFVFNQIPWTPDRITDFTLGQDKLDLHALYPGFTGSDPIAAGYVTLISDGQGGTDVLVNPDGHATAANPWPTFVVDLVGVSPAQLANPVWLV